MIEKGYRWRFKVIKSKEDEYEIREGEWNTSLSASEICRMLESWGWDEVVYLEKMCWTTTVLIENFPRNLYTKEMKFNECS